MNNILASYFTPQQTIILIVVSVVGVLLIVLNIILAYVFHKRGERKLFSKILQQQREMYLRQLNDMRSNSKFSEDTTPYKPFFNMGSAPVAVEPQEQAVEEAEDALIVDEDQDIVEEVVVNGIVMRYNRSFSARIIQATDEVKTRYSELKNYILSYKGVKGKISWKKETFRHGRNTLITFVVRGKTLCMCLALDPHQFEDTKYKIVDLSIRSPKSKTPCMYKISNDRRVKYAKELIDMLFAEDYLLVQMDRIPEDYMPPYETTEALIKRDLIRVVENENSSKEPNKTSDIEKEVIDTPIDEPAEDNEDDLSLETLDEEAEVVEEVTINGIVVRYNRSFIARLSQGSQEMNTRYSELKNYLLSFKGVKNRVSWKKETFHQGRNTLATFVVRGKTLCLCLALDPKQFEGTKYKIIDLSIRSPKSKTPCMYKISNDRRVKYAKELINILFVDNFHFPQLEYQSEDFTIPFETLEVLIARDLIRVVSNGNVDVKAEAESVEKILDQETKETETIEETLVQELKEVETVEETLDQETKEAESVEETLDQETKETETIEETLVQELNEVEFVEETLDQETKEAEIVVETSVDTLEVLPKEVIESNTEIPEVFLEDEETDDVEVVESNGQLVRYNRSYLAAIAQVSDEVKQGYSELKNYILSFKNVKSRTNWKRESFYLGKDAFACFIIRNKTLCLCLATDPKRFENTQYKVIDLSLYSDRSKLPCMYRVSNTNRLQVAKELVHLLLEEKGIEKLESDVVDYTLAYETTEELIGKGLIRISIPKK